MKLATVSKKDSENKIKTGLDKLVKKVAPKEKNSEILGTVRQTRSSEPKALFELSRDRRLSSRSPSLGRGTTIAASTGSRGKSGVTPPIAVTSHTARTAAPILSLSTLARQETPSATSNPSPTLSVFDSPADNTPSGPSGSKLLYSTGTTPLAEGASAIIGVNYTTYKPITVATSLPVSPSAPVGTPPDIDAPILNAALDSAQTFLKVKLVSRKGKSQCRLTISVQKSDFEMAEGGSFLPTPFSGDKTEDPERFLEVLKRYISFKGITDARPGNV